MATTSHKERDGRARRFDDDAADSTLDVSLPPALGLLSVVIFRLLFGLMGALFATPLMVVLMILVQKLYVEHNGPAA